MNCPICGAMPKESFASKYVSVLKCGNELCGHLWATGVAADHGVQTHPDTEGEHEKFAERNRRLVRYWIEQGLLTKDAAILDIGAGAGHIAQAIRSALPRADIVCIEADRDASALLRARGFSVVDSLEEISERRFDAILLIELIEHVDHPIKLLADCRHLMKEDAKIFLTTPCGETVLGSRRTEAYETKEHIQFFTERSLRVACHKAGFYDIRFVAPGIMYPRGHGVARVKNAAKSAIRPLRDAITGRQHLVAFVAGVISSLL